MVFVGVMGVSFVMTMIMVIPDPWEVVKGMVPRIPHESNAALLIAGMVGTTMGGVLFLVRSILVQEKGWGIEDIRVERRDVFGPIAEKTVRQFWNTPLRQGKRRYYDNCLYFFAVLALSGNYRIY